MSTCGSSPSADEPGLFRRGFLPRREPVQTEPVISEPEARLAELLQRAVDDRLDDGIRAIEEQATGLMREVAGRGLAVLREGRASRTGAHRLDPLSRPGDPVVDRLLRRAVPSARRPQRESRGPSPGAGGLRAQDESGDGSHRARDPGDRRLPHPARRRGRADAARDGRATHRRGVRAFRPARRGDRDRGPGARSATTGS